MMSERADQRTDKSRRPLWITASVVLTMAVTSSMATPTLAFSVPSTAGRAPATRLHSTPEDDEISKLIGRRSQIKRKKSEEAQAPSVPETLEPTVDLDLDKLPQFKTERPVRRKSPASEEDSEDGGSSRGSKKGKKKDGKEDDKMGPIVDFLADYDDENDWHIPNRIGITTMAWGDPKQDFVASGKLTKRMVKAGQFVPGDLQVAFEQVL